MINEKNNLQRLVAIGIFILLALLIFNLFNIFSLKSQLKERLVEIKELSRPANLELIIIKDSNCVNCFNIDKIFEKVKSADVNITKELSFNTALPKDNEKINQFIKKYDIKKLPTIILKGEINKVSFQGFEEKNDALIFNELTPPYVNANTRKIIGKVKAIVITDKSCGVCNDFSRVIQSLQQSDVVFSDINYLDYKDKEAKDFINNFNIKKVPALFLSEDIGVYSIGQQLSQQLEKIKGYYFIESPAPPYTEIDTGKIRGLINLVMLVDRSCEECYDVTIHKQILVRLGLAIKEEKTIDIESSEGKQLIEKYKIVKIPTVILNGDLKVYKGLSNIWQQVGTIEDDGTYIFRELGVLGNNIIYKDLSTGSLVK